MNLEYRRSTLVRLRDIGKDEKWLQDKIEEDPSILGLGDLTVIKREKRQSSGGRIDFLMFDPEEEVRYEVEVMLGRLDESHIIRTIEYWDLERSRYPSLEHKAVIVAEDITSRFFNVIGLLNRAIPIIALQLNAVKVDTTFTISFTKLLDITELAATDDEGSGDTKDRNYWANRASPISIALVDQITAAIPGDLPGKKITYNQGHIALRTSGRNFCWFHPRKGEFILFYLLVGAENRESILGRLGKAGISASPRGEKDISVRFQPSTGDGVSPVLKEVLAEAEKLSRGAEDPSRIESK